MKISEHMTKRLVNRDIIGIVNGQDTLELIFSIDSGRLQCVLNFSEIQYQKLSDFKKKNIAKEVTLCNFEDLEASFYQEHPYLLQYKDSRHILFKLESKTGISGIVVSKQVDLYIERTKKGQAILEKVIQERVKQRLAEDPNYYKENKHFRLVDGNGKQIPFPEDF